METTICKKERCENVIKHDQRTLLYYKETLARRGSFNKISSFGYKNRQNEIRKAVGKLEKKKAPVFAGLKCWLEYYC